MSSAPNEPSAMTCHYHPRHPANVRCGHCDKPLCAECIMHGPVGVRCVECLLGITIKPITPARWAAAVLGALATAVGVGMALGHGNLLNWLTGIGLGLAVGQVTRMVLPYVIATGAQAAAGVAAVVGVYVGTVAHYLRQPVVVAAQTVSLDRAVSDASIVQWALPALLAAGMAIYWVRRQ